MMLQDHPRSQLTMIEKAGSEFQLLRSVDVTYTSDKHAISPNCHSRLGSGFYTSISAQTMTLFMPSMATHTFAYRHSQAFNWV